MNGTLKWNKWLVGERFHGKCTVHHQCPGWHVRHCGAAVVQCHLIVWSYVSLKRGGGGNRQAESNARANEVREREKERIIS